MFVIRGQSLVGTVPAQTRCRKEWMSRGVGLGGSSLVVVDDVEGVLVIGVLRSVDGERFWGAFRSVGVGEVAVDWFLGCMLAGVSELAAVTGAETFGLSAAENILDGLLADVLLATVGFLPVDLVFVLLFAAFSSSSDDMSTTIWADIIGCMPLVILESGISKLSSNRSKVCKQEFFNYCYSGHMKRHGAE